MVTVGKTSGSCGVRATFQACCARLFSVRTHICFCKSAFCAAIHKWFQSWSSLKNSVQFKNSMPWVCCAFGNPCNAYLPWASYISNLNKSSQCIALSLICWVEVVQVTISQMHFAKEVDHFQHPALQISESDENVNVGILDFTIPMQMSKCGSKLFKANSLLVLLTETRLKRNSWLNPDKEFSIQYWAHDYTLNRQGHFVSEPNCPV